MLLFADGFDIHGALLDKWVTVFGTAALEADSGRFGTGSDALKIPDDSNHVDSAVFETVPITNARGSAANPIHIAFYFKLDGSTGEDTVLNMLVQAEGADVASVRIATDGKMFMDQLDASSSTGFFVGTTTTVVDDDQWHHIEIATAFDASSGFLKIWVDGVLEVDGTGDNITDGTLGTNGFDSLELRGANDLTDTFIDDLVIWDEEGTGLVTTGPLGLHRISTLIPDGDGTTNDFTATGAGTTNADRVDEATADGDTTYVEAPTSTNKDLYTYAALGIAPATVHGVIVNTRAKNPDIGAISMKAISRSNVTEADAIYGAFLLTGAYKMFTDYIAVDPDGGGAWDQAAINAAEFGVEVV